LLHCIGTCRLEQVLTIHMYIREHDRYVASRWLLRVTFIKVLLHLFRPALFQHHSAALALVSFFSRTDLQGRLWWSISNLQKDLLYRVDHKVVALGVNKKKFDRTIFKNNFNVKIFFLPYKWDVQHWVFGSVFWDSPHCLVKHPQKKSSKKWKSLIKNHKWIKSSSKIYNFYFFGVLGQAVLQATQIPKAGHPMYVIKFYVINCFFIIV
jgi:hypothetical protein